THAPAQRPTTNKFKENPKTLDLVGDLDGFVANFEAEQQKQVEAERLAKEKRQKELDAAPKPWEPPNLNEILKEPPRPAYSAPAPTPGSPSPAAAPTPSSLPEIDLGKTNIARKATLDALKSQTPPAPPPQAAPKAQALTRRDKEIMEVDKAM